MNAWRRPGRCAAAAKKARKDPRSDSFAAECLEPSRNQEREKRFYFRESRRRDAETETATADRSDDATAVFTAENEAAVAGVLLHRTTKTCLSVSRQIVGFAQQNH